MTKKQWYSWVKSAVLGVMLIYSAPAAQAGDDALYPAAPPPGSAFIRFFNAEATGAAPIKVNGKTYGAAEYGVISAYAPVQGGNAEVTIGSDYTPTNLIANHYYTAVRLKNRVVVLPEPQNNNLLKAQIVLINLSDEPNISLKTADGVTYVVTSVNPGAIGGRAVNAVSVPFSVYAGNDKLQDLAPKPLERGSRYAVVVYEDKNGKPAVIAN